ncbi:hypothetical protein BME24068_03185 [Burkholderia metallica]|nr:hypothetical protein BME24068_03185 [Burkholderia metallica]
MRTSTQVKAPGLAAIRGIGTRRDIASRVSMHRTRDAARSAFTLHPMCGCNARNQYDTATAPPSGVPIARSPR